MVKMADDIHLVKLRSSNSRLKQYSIDLERTVRKLTNARKKLIKEVKYLKDENSRLKRIIKKTGKIKK